MKSYKKIILPLILLIAFLISALCGCNPKAEDPYDFVFDNKYNATLYDQAIDFNWFSEDYLLENMLNVCYNGDFDVEQNEIINLVTGEKGIIDEIYPYERTNVIETQEEFAEAFVSFPDEVDFEKQVLVLYFYRRRLPKKCLDNKLESIKFSESLLEIVVREIYTYQLGSKGEPPKNAIHPRRECYVIKMDKLNYGSATVTKNRKTKVLGHDVSACR